MHDFGFSLTNAAPRVDGGADSVCPPLDTPFQPFLSCLHHVIFSFFLIFFFKSCCSSGFLVVPAMSHIKKDLKALYFFLLSNVRIVCGGRFLKCCTVFILLHCMIFVCLCVCHSSQIIRSSYHTAVVSFAACALVYVVGFKTLQGDTIQLRNRKTLQHAIPAGKCATNSKTEAKAQRTAA